MLLVFLQAGGKGPVAQQFYDTASPAAKAMLQAYRITGECHRIVFIDSCVGI
jgi:hypothetical protein